MALSYVAYTGTGSTTDYVISFPYIAQSDVFVIVSGVSVPFTFISTAAVRCAVAPAAGTAVQVRRLTAKLSVPVDFADGSNLLERDLDLLGTWTLYQAQESGDISSDLLGLAGAPLNSAVAAAVQANVSANAAALSASQVSTAVGDIASATLAAKGAGQVGFGVSLVYPPSTIGEALRNLRLRQVSAFDFMTPAQIADVASYTGALDVTAAVQAALTSIANTTYTTPGAAYSKGGGAVFLPPGKYKITDTLKVGSNTKLHAVSAIGGTAPSVTTNTGTVLEVNFTGNLKRWVISSATYETSGGGFAAFNTTYTGAQHDAGAITLTMGIEIEGLLINGNGAYGGVRLMAGSDGHVHDCMVNNTAVGYLFSACYGIQYERLHALHALHGIFIRQCTAVKGGQAYADKAYSNWVIDATTRLISVIDFGSAAFMPDWSQKTFGIYADGCITVAMSAQVSEHSDIGLGMSNVTGLSLHGYFEGNVESNLGFVTCSGSVSAFANATTNGTKYHFGVNNNLTLNDCSFGAIYVGHPQNTVRIQGGSVLGGAAADWTWSDYLTFVGLDTLLVSATGSASAVFGYTTLDEALRRIGAGLQRNWVVKIRDGDTVATAAQRALSDKTIRFEREGTGVRPTISVAPAGGGFVFRCPIQGDLAFTFRNVNIALPAAPSAAAGDAALFLISTNTAARVTLNIQGHITNLGAGYNLFRVSAGGALNLTSTFSDFGVTSVTPSPIASVGGSAVIINSASGGVVDANIRALGTNGWQGTVLSSNFV